MISKTITVTTVSENEELLTNTNIRALIKERLGILSDGDYTALLSSKGFTLNFRIKFTVTNNKVSINNGIYSETEGHYYMNEGYDSGIKSIKIRTADTVRFTFSVE